MPLEHGTRLGPYEILAPLGAGGMGEVYRARDTRLGREVAVKVVPTQLSANPEVRARFEREARTISGLNHPNICTLYDVGREGETEYLVMELIAGETLANRLARGPLPLPDLLRLGIEIASALDRAHRAGVVHRDLKPGNVMLTKSGSKLMDFGLARPVAAAVSNSLAATITAPPSPPGGPLTSEGTILGTIQYMAPEQLEGREADTRSDIWAFGCLLYEMMTGQHAFEGRSQASLIAAILERQPAGLSDVPTSSASLSLLNAPAALQRLIRHCLAKDPDDRFQTAHDLKLQLQGIAESLTTSSAAFGADLAASATAVATTRQTSRTKALLPWAAAAAATIAAVVAAVMAIGRNDRADLADFRFRINPIPNVDMLWPHISPDGRMLVVVGEDSVGIRRAFLRPLDQIGTVPIVGSEGLTRPYWSPDGREIAFLAGDKIQRLPISGGTPIVVCSAPGGADISWGSKGRILMDGQAIDSLRVVSAGGGELQPASRIDRAANEIGSAWPHFLPDGEHFLFIGVLASTTAGGNMRLGKLGSLESKLLGPSDGRVEYAPGGWVLFLRGTTLLAQKLDLGAGKLTGQPITVAENLKVDEGSGDFSVSRNGTLAYASGGAGVAMPIRVADRSGAFSGPPLANGVLSNPKLSPDASRLLYQRSSSGVGGPGEIHVVDLRRGTDTRLTFTNGRAATPVWSPDGKRVAYTVRERGFGGRIRVSAADGLGRQDSIPLPAPMSAELTQWIEPGSRLIFYDHQFRGFAIPTAGPFVPQPLTDTTEAMGHQQISPDGRWLAVTMGIVPNLHVFVWSLGGPPGRWQISAVPGTCARWTKGGRELIYEGFNDDVLYAVDIDTRETFHAGTPRALFKLPQDSFGIQEISWTCDPAGERFYLMVPPREQRQTVIEVASGFKRMVSRK